jgi:GNAT superfamily N-acetyltransferase
VNLPPIVRAAPTDIDLAAQLIADGFAGLAAAAWLVPDPDRRRAVLHGNFRIAVEHAIVHGHVDLLADRTAVAVWFHRDKPAPPPPHYEQRLAAACGQHTKRFQVLDNLLHTHHPIEAHHHLALLAVSPAHWRTGRGTALLRHHHTDLDQAGLPAYLEASSTDSRALYARHGYLAARPLALPDGTAFWPMWRPPRPHRSQQPARPHTPPSPPTAARHHRVT